MRYLSPKDISSIQNRIQSHRGQRSRGRARLRQDLVGKTVLLRLPQSHIFYNQQAVILGQRLADGQYKVLISGTSTVAYLDEADIHLDSAVFGRA